VGRQATIINTLRDSAGGHRLAAERLMVAVYRELRALAASHLRRERPDHTLQPTALVHEAFLRLIELDHVDWIGRTHFLSVASRQMRRVLVDHARKLGAQKRGGSRQRVTLADLPIPQRDDVLHVIAIDDALTRLFEAHPRQGRVAEMRLFSGMNVNEMASELKVSPRTIKSDWRLARAFIARELQGDRPEASEDSQ
jgi:RNA polymerase sigma factor (TIGR02999 family)